MYNVHIGFYLISMYMHIVQYYLQKVSESVSFFKFLLIVVSCAFFRVLSKLQGDLTLLPCW